MYQQNMTKRAKMKAGGARARGAAKRKARAYVKPARRRRPLS
jgi:hypothetical protein